MKAVKSEFKVRALACNYHFVLNNLLSLQQIDAYFWFWCRNRLEERFRYSRIPAGFIVVI